MNDLESSFNGNIMMRNDTDGDDGNHDAEKALVRQRMNRHSHVRLKDLKQMIFGYYKYPSNPVYDFLVFYCDDGIKNDLATTIRSLRKREEETNSPVNFQDLSSVLSYADSWSTSVWECVWLTNQLVVSDPDAARNVVEFTGFMDQFPLVRQLRHTAPVIGAIAERGIGWQDVPLLLRRRLLPSS